MRQSLDCEKDVHGGFEARAEVERLPQAIANHFEDDKELPLAFLECTADVGDGFLVIRDEDLGEGIAAALGFLTDTGTISVLLIYLLSALTSATSAFDAPARHPFLPTSSRESTWQTH
jgi:hypothetical protein